VQPCQLRERLHEQGGDDMNGHSISKWVCNNHGEDVHIQDHVTYQDIAEAGIPICSECGEDMEFISEKWVEG